MFFKPHRIAEYYYGTATVAGGVTNQEVALDTLLAALGRDAKDSFARYLVITTDVAVTLRLNSTSAGAIPVGTSVGFTLPEGQLAVRKLYLTHPGSCGAGAASVKILAI